LRLCFSGNQNVFSRNSAFFGEEPIDFAKNSLNLFQKEGTKSILELGCGQGRDTFLFTQSGLEVTALDYSETAISAIQEKAQAAGLASKLHARTHNVKEAIPFSDNSFDACFSHMLLCMELSTVEIGFIMKETHRILKPGGLAVYSVRSNFDKHYRTGTHLGEDLYEVGGFVIHFFTEEKIKKLAKGYEILEIKRVEEGSLPRDLFMVTLQKAACPEEWNLDEIKGEQKYDLSHEEISGVSRCLFGNGNPGKQNQATGSVRRGLGSRMRPLNGFWPRSCEGSECIQRRN
jgi:SAM-dependent methyltransferase